MLGFTGTRPDADFAALLRETGARGVILFARNIVDAEQTRALIGEIRSLVPWPLLLAVDQEGGAVVRVARGATVFPGNMALGAADSVELAERQGRESGRQLAAMGFDLNLAPVVDLQTNPANPGIGIRSLGADLARAVPLAEALVRGHLESGVSCCLKHFPGKGAAAIDAHRDLPVLELSLAEFRHPHLAIFAELFARCARVAVMTSHVSVTGLDAEWPATLSPRVVREVLRGELGFEGLLLTDDLEMGAIVKRWGVGVAALRAIDAGHDMVLVCHEPTRQREAAAELAAALGDGRIAPAAHRAAVARIEEVAQSHRTPAALDRAHGDAVASEIAERAVHVFADPRGLLPLRPGQRIVALAFRPRSIVGVEEADAGGFEAAVAGALASAGLREVEVIPLELDGPPPGVPESLARAERVLLFTWDARGQARVREWLALACREAAERLVVVHLRNPFDQALVPVGITSLTAFGYQTAQLRALAGVLTGRALARGRMPAPLV
jgi:beta-N-acetylhexosaminidase